MRTRTTRKQLEGIMTARLFSSRTLEPFWNEAFLFEYLPEDQCLTLDIYDWDPSGEKQELGSLMIDPSPLEGVSPTWLLIYLCFLLFASGSGPGSRCNNARCHRMIMIAW